MNLSDNVFCCFDSRCGKQGDVIDLWAAVAQMSAARGGGTDLVRTFEARSLAAGEGTREEARLTTRLRASK